MSTIIAYKATVLAAYPEAAARKTNVGSTERWRIHDNAGGKILSRFHAARRNAWREAAQRLQPPFKLSIAHIAFAIRDFLEDQQVFAVDPENPSALAEQTGVTTVDVSDPKFPVIHLDNGQTFSLMITEGHL